MPASKWATDGRGDLAFSLVIACAAVFATAAACTRSDDPIVTTATGGLGQGDGGHTSSGGSQSGGAPSGGSSAGGAGSGGMGGEGGSLGWPGGQTSQSACPTDAGEWPVALPEVEDGGDVLFSPEEGACPDGTVPSERVHCTDVAICACEYPCSPACEPSEVCDAGSEGNACSCHPAMDGQPGDCHWPGLLDADVLDGCGPWHFTVSDDGAEVVAEVGDGLLHLGVERRCQIVFAQTVARLPPADAFPEGAAIVFEYRARGEPGGGQATPNSVSIGSGHGGLPARAEPAQHRLCARLGPYPRLVDLTLAIENFGSCDEETPAEIWVSNLRLEADEGCL